jgi:uncharacterized protein (TIGR03000 family)
VSNCTSVLIAPVCGVCACYQPPVAVVVPSTTVVPSYGTPVTPTPMTPPTETLPKPKAEAAFEPNVARVLIKAPVEMVIRINGETIKHDQDEMTYRTPQLEMGQAYTYEVQTEIMKEGKPVKETKQVSVKAGQQTVMDFTPKKKSATALVTLKLPEGARLFVDGAPYALPVGQRTFTTPALNAGETYHYNLKAEMEQAGKIITETQRVNVMAGKQVTVEFNKLAIQQTAAVAP